jgi:ketosteroid isomerase-like protein
MTTQATKGQSASNAVSRETVQAFYDAYISRDPQRIGAMVTDDIEWHVAGPVSVVQICGTWRGREAVIERFASYIPSIIAFQSLEVEKLLVDDDASAMFGRIISRHCQSGRIISHRISHLVRYRDGKAASFRCINDSLDAAEQFIGHAIDFSDDAPPTSDDFVAV